ncbi:class I SAM-dependent methyltransferase [Actinoplanes auranticolor]|uniref:S-adenosyl-L-methionine-dependent methyltransferase n=1 Tax=Actinoplanes auranticolor TaxID=47988 RepID=A0A919SHZ1_9ACTN|nr:class I SAM-dependent methyltransferase [Actinoplanes auranticolor]GIM72029.1 S-adenosyl-L-methionine-dependent methyltransferase [Actinoplanes auranticolor]
MTARPPAAQTAFGPMVIAACEQLLPAHQRLFDDPDAVRMLPPGQRLIVGACRWKPVHRLLVRATDSKAQGLWAGMLCRKRYADDKVRDALHDGIKQFVFLGAGLDTRPYRLVAPTGARSIETDLPANIAYKRRRLTEAYGRLPAGTTLTAVDLETDDLTDALTAAGFDWNEPAMVVWEAVTQYLTEDAVHRTLAGITRAAPGSRLIVTYLRRDFLDGTRDYGAAPARQEFVTKRQVWHFGLLPEETAALLGGYGWTEHEQVGPAEYAERYLRPLGRDLAVSPIERFVYADRSTDAPT